MSELDDLEAAYTAALATFQEDPTQENKVAMRAAMDEFAVARKADREAAIARGERGEGFGPGDAVVPAETVEASASMTKEA